MRWRLMLGERCSPWMSRNGTLRECWAACVFGQNNDNPAANRGMADAHGAFAEAINTRNNNNQCRRAFVSLHPGGSQFCLGDGSVKFITEAINWNAVAGVDSLAERLASVVADAAT